MNMQNQHDLKQAVITTRKLRLQLIEHIYRERGNRDRGFVHLYSLEQLVGDEVELDLDLELAYLVDRGHLKKDDHRYAITAGGVVFFEQWVLENL